MMHTIEQLESTHIELGMDYIPFGSRLEPYTSMGNTHWIYYTPGLSIIYYSSVE